MVFEVKGKNVFITAASKGIGFATAKAFLEGGANVAISSSDENNISDAVSGLEKITGKKPYGLKCDLNKKEDIESAFRDAESKYGYIDILINNCGGPAPGYFNDFEEGDWDHAYQQVLMSALQLIRLALPGMKNNKWGRIINITSLSVKQPVENLLLSNVFRSGLVSAAKTISMSESKNNITFNNISPGFIHTERLDNLALNNGGKSGKSAEDILSEMANAVPVKKLGKADDIAALALFLASENAGYINGQTIAVDGGLIKSTY